MYSQFMGAKDGAKIDLSPIGCNDVDARTMAAMMAVLTTLISLSRKAD